MRFTHPQAFVAQYRAMFHERMYAAALGPAPVILDVGANYGLAAIALKAEHPDAEIVAFEADPAIAAIAEANIAAAGLRGVTLVRAAAWTCRGHDALRRRGQRRRPPRRRRRRSRSRPSACATGSTATSTC